MSGDDLDTNADLLRVLGHTVRLELLTALIGGERSVGDIEASTGITQPGLSQQLAVLRKADLVTARREAKQVFYSLNREPLQKLHEFCAGLVGKSPDAPPTDPVRGTGGAAVFARVTRP
ncbi:metalloregulator ArsR/SmtB family transcription factor [Novosphingobium sp. ZN18A2]|uniref:ArsR/SmtB family transcription factor n=1 Tax=Novosphingobium sp. ZN18A2 TaxID=3079861 RepID=UPI0030D615B2